MAKFLPDQDIYRATVNFLSKANLDVVSVSQLGLSRAKDTEILKTVQAQANSDCQGQRLWQHGLRSVVGVWCDLPPDITL